jgi:hypothetical protein
MIDCLGEPGLQKSERNSPYILRGKRIALEGCKRTKILSEKAQKPDER